MNKSNENRCNLSDYKLNVSGMDAPQFKVSFIKASMDEIAISADILDRETKLLLKLSKVLSGSNKLTSEQKYDSMQMIEGLYTIGRLIIDAGGIDKITPEKLKEAFIDWNFIDSCFDMEALIRINWLIFTIMAQVAEDEFAFELKEKEGIVAIMQRIVTLIELLINNKTIDYDTK